MFQDHFKVAPAALNRSKGMFNLPITSEQFELIYAESGEQAPEAYSDACSPLSVSLTA